MSIVSPYQWTNQESQKTATRESKIAGKVGGGFASALNNNDSKNEFSISNDY